MGSHAMFGTVLSHAMRRVITIRVLMMACAVGFGWAPASAQIDLSGSWAPRMHEDWFERGPGRDFVDYTGLPLPDEARAKALTWLPTVYAMQERQCILLSPYVTAFEPQGLRIWSEMEDGRVIAWKVGGTIEHAIITIWMDGRSEPSSNEPYAFSGFTTGTWEGDTLTAYTTHCNGQ